MQMTSTLFGMEQYYNLKKQSLFDDIRLPDGVDKQTLVNTILVESGEFETIYTNGDFLRIAIKTWFERKYKMLDKWIKAINTEYKPLENYNRTETWTDESEGSTSNNGTKNSKTTNSGSDSGTDTTKETIEATSSGSNSVGSQTSSDEAKTSAFNSDTYSPNQRTDSTVSARTDSSSNTSNNTKDGTLTKSNSFKNESTLTDSTSDSGTSSNSSSHSGNIYGNIGVTTSQKMLEEEVTLWGKIDIYHDTAEMFVQDFCIMVY